MLCVSVVLLIMDFVLYSPVRGYIAPEYVLHGQLSEKADTYSFGIVVLEIISGQKSTDVKVDDDDNEEYLLRQVRNSLLTIPKIGFFL